MTKQQIDWPEILRSGPEGVKKWNKLTRGQRKVVALTGVDFSSADLTGVNLYDADANKAKFVNAILTGAKLEGGSFDSTDFSGANLELADMRAARFRKASFVGAKLSGANLTTASVQGANFASAVLQDTIFEKAWFDKNTTWAASFDIPPELTWFGRGTDPRLSGKGKSAIAVDVTGLIVRLNSLIDSGRMKRTMDMLKSGKNQLFSEIEAKMVRGIVRSQKEEGLVYSCMLSDDGTYSCCTPDVSQCMGLRGEPCKHLLVLIIGLIRAGLLEPAKIDGWLVAAKNRNPRWNKTIKNYLSDTLLKYKGVQAGEIDWRPTETLPEDFYAM